MGFASKCSVDFILNLLHCGPDIIVLVDWAQNTRLVTCLPLSPQKKTISAPHPPHGCSLTVQRYVI